METLCDFGGKIGGARKDMYAGGSPSVGASAQTVRRRAARPPRFGVSATRVGDGWRFFAARFMRGSARRLVPIQYFETSEAAYAWVRATPADELERLHKAAIAALAVTDDNCRRPENAPRMGIDYRGGANVEPAQFLAEFNLYGVEFGNWQDDRHSAVNKAYDAFRDLAAAVGLPLSAIGFSGRLGLAFGARGRGRWSAHFEPDRFAINLTKTKGAGSLAHEWFHAFDYASSDNAPARGFTITEPLRELARTLRGLGMYRRARAADATRSAKAYFSTAPEMAARAFEAWVRGRVENDYLANIRKLAEFNRPTDCYPYPLPEEMPAIDAAFKKLFNV